MSITVKAGPDSRGTRGAKATRSLPAIFGRTINQMAAKSGGISAENYMSGFRTVKEERDGELESIADAVLVELIEKHPREWLLNQSRKAGKGSSS